MAPALVLWFAASAAASTITVTTTTDELGGSVECSLRDAVQSANTNASFGGCERTGTGAKDTIRLVEGLTFGREIDIDADDANMGGDLDITGNTVIKVMGDEPATIDANDMDRAIDVRPGGRLEASNLVILDGELALAFSENYGGAIRVEEDARLELASSRLESNETLGNGGCSCGGAIGTRGATTLRNVTLHDNDASLLAGGIALVGGDLLVLRSTLSQNVGGRTGGIYIGGFGDVSVKVVRSTLTANHSLSDTIAGGGGIYAGAGGSGNDVRVTNSTISGNLSGQSGGGIHVGSGTIKVNATTITGNTADYEEDGNGAGGGVSGNGGTYKNSIIADNINPLAPGNEDDCAGPFFSLGGTNNLIGKDTGCLKPPGTKATVDPLLAPLADNGGPTLTHKLLADSKAIGLAGNSAPPKDQRGRKRDSNPDAGSFER